MLPCKTALIDYNLVEQISCNFSESLNVEKKNFTANQHLSLWKGDLNEKIKEAIDKECVTPWLINMAPMVSPK